jgi:hypothetical protein
MERVFSCAGLILSSRRTRLSEQLFKDLIFLKVIQTLLCTGPLVFYLNQLLLFSDIVDDVYFLFFTCFIFVREIVICQSIIDFFLCNKDF